MSMVQTFVTAQSATQTFFRLPVEIALRAKQHLAVEGGNGRVCFEFDVKDGKAVSCRAIVEGSRKDLT